MIEISKYRYEICWDEEDKIYIGKVREFESLSAHGETQEEALREIKKVVEMVVEDLLAEGEEVPLPYQVRNFSGKLNIRIPKDLHRELTEGAVKNGISLNQYITHKLSRS